MPTHRRVRPVPWTIWASQRRPSFQNSWGLDWWRAVQVPPLEESLPAAWFFSFVSQLTSWGVLRDSALSLGSPITLAALSPVTCGFLSHKPETWVCSSPWPQRAS